MDSNQTPVPAPASEKFVTHRRFQWLVIMVVLLAPALLAFIGAAIKLEDFAVASPLIGGGIGGIYCGVLLGRRFGKMTYVKILLGLLVGAVAACTIIGIGFAGCMLGGFTVKFS